MIMATIVCSELDYLHKNPNAKFTFGQVEHALEHLKARERVSSFVTLASAGCLVLAMASVITGGMFLVGALAAIAAISSLYTMACREAESAMRSKQVQWMGGDVQSKKVAQEETTNNDFLGLNWFSKLPFNPTLG
jgi:hypothetical protein